MIDSQKHNIIALRQKGMSYGEIANKLEISINTIKSFCRRSSIEQGKNICKHCGKPVEQNPGRREKKFCSDACRMKWWSAHPEMGKRSVRLVCPVCGKTFMSHRNAKRKYCSHKCYITARFGGCQHEQG